MSLLEPKGPDDLHHLAAAYALDAVDADERRRFEAHYPTCSICAQEVLEFRETAAILASGAAVTPPPDLKAQIMAEVGRTQQLSPVVPDQLAARRRQLPRAAGILAAAAAIVLVAVGSVAVLRDRGGGGEAEVVDLLAAPDARLATLEGETGTLRVVWSAARDQVAVVGDGLADPGPGRTYALWFLVDDGVTPAGLFEPGSGGAIRQVVDVADIDGLGFGVSIEPDGGSPQPTGEVLYIGQF